MVHLRPLFNHSHPPFKTDTFLESGCDDGHLVLLRAVLAGNVILHAFWTSEDALRKTCHNVISQTISHCLVLYQIIKYTWIL
jgi:hypothetical protein